MVNDSPTATSVLSMALLQLTLASVAYAVGGLLMKMSAGLTRPLPTVGFLALFAGGAVLQALGMRQADLTVSYAVVLGMEAVAAVLLGVVVLREDFPPARAVAIGLIVAGIVWLRRS